MQRRVKEQTGGLRPTASRAQILQVLKRWQSVAKMPPSVCQEVQVRLMEVLKGYAAARLKQDAAEASFNAFTSEAVVEKTLETLLHIMKENDVTCILPMFWTLFQHLLNLMCLKKRQTTNEVRFLTLQCTEVLLKSVISKSKKLNEEALCQTELNNCLAFAVYQCFEKIHEEHPRGEKEIAKGSFVVLRSLLDVFTVPALWFGVLPAAATELSALLTAVGKMVKGNEAVLPWSRITEDAVRLFTRLLCFVLADDNVHDLVPPTARGSPSLKQLQDIIHMASRNNKHGEKQACVSSIDGVKKSSAVEGSWEWFQFSSKKVEKLIQQCLPPLMHHSHASVRIALGEGVSQLIEKCKICLGSCMKDLLRILLTLSLDPFSKVASSCQPAIEQMKEQLSKLPEDCGWANGWQGAIESLIKDEICGLSDALRSSEATAQRAARTLAAAVRVSGGDHFASWVLDDTFQLESLHRAWIDAFTFDARAVNALYQSTNEIGRPGKSEKGPLLSSVVPKMPLALVFMTERDTYTAMSQFIRSVSSAMSSTCMHTLGLQILMDRVLDGLRDACEQNASQKHLCIASHICLLTEIIYGARSTVDGSSSTCLEPFIWRITQTVDMFDLWRGETDHDVLSPKNAAHTMLIWCLLESVRISGSLLNTCLLDLNCHIMDSWMLPVLEACADPAPSVQSTAEKTLLTLQKSLGFASTSDLVLKFSDSIVQGLCHRLSELSAYPRAPALLAVLLKRVTGPSRKLLHLLAEPVSHVLKGLSIQGRTFARQFTVPYLESLIEVAAITRDVAQSVLSYLKDQLKTCGRGGFSDTVPSEILAQMKDLRAASVFSNSITHMAAPLFQDPRIQVDSLPVVCLMAFEVCTIGTKALKSTTKCCRLFEDRLMPSFPKNRPEASVATAEIPQLSTTIGPVWRSLVVAMKRRPVAVVEGVLKFFADVAGVFDGRTLSRRFTEEAWPLLKALLDQGHAQPPVRHIIPHKGSFAVVRDTESDAIAPQSRTRGQMAAFLCLERIGQDPMARYCLRTRFPELVTLLFAFLSADHSSEIQQKATETLKAIALVDADYVWAVLMDQPSELPHWQDLYSYLETAEVSWHQRLRETLLLA